MIFAASIICRHASMRNALKPHCVSQKGRPVATRTSKLKTRPPCSRRHGCRFPISSRLRAREPKAISTSPRAIGSTIFGSSSIGVERSASKKTAIGFVALNNPLLTAAPLPRLGKFSSNRIATADGTAATLRVPSPVASVEPSLMTITSLPGLSFSRYAIVVASVSPMRTASLKAGMTTETAGSMNGSSVSLATTKFAGCKLALTSFVNFDYELAVLVNEPVAALADMASIHSASIKWQRNISILVHCNETAGAAKLFGLSQRALGRFRQRHSAQFHQRRDLVRHTCTNEKFAVAGA